MIDARIPLGVQLPPPMPSPMAQLGDVLQIQALVQQRNERARAQQERQQIEQVLAQYPDDPDQALAVLRRMAPSTALALEQTLAESRKAQAEATKGRLDAERLALEQGLRLFQGVTDEPGYQAARTWALKQSPQLEGLLPPAYDPQRVGQVVQVGLDAKTYVEASRKALDDYLAGKPHEALGRVLSVAPNQAAWEQTITSARALGVRPEVIEAFGAEWSPEAQARAAALAMTPQQRATVEGQAEARKETARHNQEMERAALLRAKRTGLGTGTGGTSPQDTGGLTQEGIEYAATQYRVTGTMPPLGMGKTPARPAIINAAARQARELRQTPAVAIQKQAAFKSDAKALDQMQKMRAGAQAYETKARQQGEIVREYSEKVSRTQWPFINRAIQSGRIEVLGDKDAQLLANAITTFSSEYAKIIEGSTGSVAGSSDAARRAAERLINTSLNKGTMSATIDLMQREMDLTLMGYDATIEHITQRMGGAPAEPAPASAPTKPADPLGIR